VSKELISIGPTHTLKASTQMTLSRAYRWLVSQFDEGLWQQWPLPSTEICFWHITGPTGL